MRRLWHRLLVLLRLRKPPPPFVLTPEMICKIALSRIGKDTVLNNVLAEFLRNKKK